MSLRPHRRMLLRLLAFTSVWLLAAPVSDAAANQQLQVSVTIDRVDNLHSGDFFRCFDHQVLGCGRGDFYAVMGFFDGDNTFFPCDQTGFTENRDFITPGWTCTVGGVPRSLTLKAPVRFVLDIWDFDGRGLYAIDGDDHADLVDEGASRTLIVSVPEGTSTFVNPGNADSIDLQVTITFTATIVPDRRPLTHVSIDHQPVLPVVGDALTFTARALDDRSSLRPVYTIEIYIAIAGRVAVRSEPTAPWVTCYGQPACNVMGLTGLATATGRIAYRAIATDESGVRVASPWRLVDVSDVGAFGASASPQPLMAGVVSEPFGLVREHTTLDIVFFPGTGHDVGTRDGLDTFSRAILGSTRYFMQPQGGASPSTMLVYQQYVSVWGSPRNVTIKHSKPNEPGSAGDLCEIDGLEVPSFAEVNGVLHTVRCRDNAPGNKYTARYPELSWHELHHAAFGLADEYWAMLDGVENSGGYFQTNPYPNLYFWPADCAADPLSGGVCFPLRPEGSPLPGQSTRWWRYEPRSDVMINNSVQNNADRRRSSWYFGECQKGRC